jgi:uncharacterized protein
MAAAHYLAGKHEVHLYEAADRLGGHTATIDVASDEGVLSVDTGFIVYNDWTYPGFIQLLDELKVANQPTNMSFSVSDRVNGLEYAGNNLNTLFAQRKNLFSGYFLRMVRDILRFNKQAEQHLAQHPEVAAMTLGEYLQRYGYGEGFREHYLVPMGAAIWSGTREGMENFPLGFFVRFFRNHGLLNIVNRPQWRVIKGGSKQYIEPLTAAYRDNIHLSCPILAVRRDENAVTLATARGEQQFDQVVLACHSDQALAMLADASVAETQLLGAIPYQRNEVVLHTDSSLLPRSRACWSSWNVSLTADGNPVPRLTYNMNILQSLQARETYCVTLNQTDEIDASRIIGVYHYDHPVFTLPGMDAQARWQEINGVRRTWFCGAYWRNGFHEDGVWSARRVADGILGFTGRV